MTRAIKTTGVGQAPSWRFRSKHGHENTVPLYLLWEVYCDPITDDYDPDEITAGELWQKWVCKYAAGRPAEPNGLPPAHVNIYWSVRGGPIFEAAPFQGQSVDFLTYFTWPRDARTGVPLRWGALPAADKLWRPGRADKGGFIQELTGWKPSPLQASVDVRQLAAMTGLPWALP
jgi:hypothetical protein